MSAVEDVIDFALSLSDARGYLSKVDDDAEFYAELDRMIESRRDALLSEAEHIKTEAATLAFKALYDAACELDGYLRFGFELSRMQYRGKDPECAALYERFKELKGECKAFRADLADVEAAKTVESAPYARAVCAIALDALRQYEARKAALGRIDYADLEHGALKVLSDPECMREIAKSVDFVFIDEYQDVNPLQAEIASLLKNSAGAEMFLVGDIKQSIYAFRRCNPVFFKNALGDPDYTRVLLNRNYRSSTEVIDFVNKVFTGVMSDKFGGADYNVDKLICGNPSHGSAEFYAATDAPAKKEKPAAGDEKKTAPTPYSVMNATKGVEREDEQARLIVDLILDHADGGAGFGSVAVLVRSARTPFCDGLVRLMRANGIPCNLGRKSKVSDYPEAEALLRIARCVDNRFDDVALYTALRSPMGGFSDDELLQIATAGEAFAIKLGVEPESGFGTSRKSYCFWQKARAYKGEHAARLDSFFARRDALAEYARSH
ncbi:MAG: UvrD-helicase domain-containing protein, partial [Clostridiales bacterium]|nr:UvrD-helicase domain-containing protein [Clostridiales bacterium]